MKFIYTIFLLFFCNVIIAQLHVGNNAFVYVDGTGFTSGPDVAPLFVTDDVNINSTGHIYLRNDAQLLQGSGITGNSGIGKLSIYQDGKASAAAYNYWCSPVGNILSNDNTNRPFRANNNIYDVTAAPITSSLATYMQAPNYNGTTSPLVIADYWLWSYNPGIEYSEWDHVLSGGDVTSGYGFTMKGTLGSSNNQLYDFRGKPNSGTILTSVLNGQETLVGNPYPSALDARDYIHKTANVPLLDSGTLYFWDQDLTITSHVIVNYRGGYATYTINSAGTVESFNPATFDSYNYDGTDNNGGPVSSNGKSVYRYIPVGQGFMIKGAANGSVRTTNDMRKFEKEATNVSEFFRQQQNNNSRTDYIQYNEEGLQIVPEDYKRFRINVDFDGIYTRQLLQNFHYSATEGKDYGLESKSPELIESDAHWIQDGEAYSAQAFNFQEELTIPLHVNIENQQLVRFRIFDVQNFDESQSIYLHDIENNLYVNLRSQNYEIALETGNYTNRFEITFRANALSTDDIVLDDFTIYQNNNASELTIVNPNQLNIKTVSLFDVTGKQVFAQSNLPIQTNHTFSTKNLSDGVYVTQLTFKSNQELSKKIIISNKK